MKACPKCSRTYADEGFTFCLEDGALLSAPYDPDKEEPVSTIQSGGPPPTAVLPREQKSADHQLTTIASPPPIFPNASSETKIASTPAPQKRKFGAIPITIGIVLLLILGYAVFNTLYIRNLRSCPKVRIQCYQAVNSARCYLTTESATTEREDGEVGPAMSSLRPVLALQQIAQLPEGIRNVRWSTSGGKITSSEYAEVFIDTTAMQKSVILVNAKFDRDSLICPNEVQTLFVVGATQP